MSPSHLPPKNDGGVRAHYAFVGAFRESSTDGSVGGQLAACRSLVASPLAQHIRFSTIDSTMLSVPPPPLPTRAHASVRRIGAYLRLLLRRDVDGALIFSSAGASFAEKGLMAICARRAGKRVVFSPRSGLIHDDVLRSAAMRRFVIQVLRASHVVMCQSDSWKEYFSELTGLSDERFAVVPNWLEVRRHRDIFVERSRRDAAVAFLYLGWLEPYKGVLDLVEAVSLARHQRVGCRFTICGRGSLDQEARTLAADRGLADYFDFRGWVTGSAKERLLEEADVLVLPSHREGMPNALLEAMAAGLAVVATRVGGVPDVLVDESLGILVDPRSPEQLASSLVSLARDRAKSLALGAAARQRVLERHDIDVLWPQVLRLLKPLERNNPP